VVAIADDGRCASARIEIEAAPARLMQ